MLIKTVDYGSRTLELNWDVSGKFFYSNLKKNENPELPDQTTTLYQHAFLFLQNWSLDHHEEIRYELSTNVEKMKWWLNHKSRDIIDWDYLFEEDGYLIAGKKFLPIRDKIEDKNLSF